MSEEAPLPSDSLGSLFIFASWLYPRVWMGFALLCAVTLLPGELLILAGNQTAGLESTTDFVEAARGGAWARILIPVASMAAFVSLMLLYGWAGLSLGDSVAGGGDISLRGALRATVARLPAQVWTLVHMVVRLFPLVFVGGVVAGFTARESPLTAIAVVVVVALPIIYFTMRWMFSSAVTLFEGLSGGAALRRSSELSGARFGLVAFHFIVYNAIVLSAAILISVMSESIVPDWGAGLVGTVLGGMLVTPFTAGMFLGLYRREAARGAAQEAARV